MIARRIHFYLLAFLGVTAIGGGGILIISPSGKLLGGLPLSILVKSPFKDFFYPCIILFLILGVLPCLVIYSLIQKPESKFAESLNFFQRYVLGLVVQYLYSFCPDDLDTSRNHFIQGVGWLQTFYILFAILIIFVALLPQVRIFYKK